MGAGDQTDRPPAPAAIAQGSRDGSLTALVLSGFHVLRTNQREAGGSQSHRHAPLPKARRARPLPGPQPPPEASAAPHWTPRGLGRGLSGPPRCRSKGIPQTREDGTHSATWPAREEGPVWRGSSCAGPARRPLPLEQVSERVRGTPSSKTQTQITKQSLLQSSTEQILAKQPKQWDSDARARPLGASEQTKGGHLPARADSKVAWARGGGRTGMALK